MENIHSQMYSQLIETYVQDREEKSKMFNALENFDCIKKADWAKKWIADNRSSFATRLVAFACVEGIFFSGAFCSIFGLKNAVFYQDLPFLMNLFHVMKHYIQNLQYYSTKN